MPGEAISLSDDERWQVEQDVKTLKEAQLIHKDQGRLEKAMSLMGEEMEAMSTSMEEAARKRFINTTFKS